MDFSTADQYIEASHVRELNVSSLEVHANLWPIFEHLLATTGAAAGWKYEQYFNVAVDCVKSDYKLTTTTPILEDKNMQYRLGFNFIMHLYH